MTSSLADRIKLQAKRVAAARGDERPLTEIEERALAALNRGNQTDLYRLLDMRRRAERGE